MNVFHISFSELEYGSKGNGKDFGFTLKNSEEEMSPCDSHLITEYIPYSF